MMRNFFLLFLLSLILSIQLTKAREDCSTETTLASLMLTCGQAKESQCDDLPRLFTTALPSAPPDLIKACVSACKMQDVERLKMEILSIIAIQRPECLFEVNEILSH